jgi:hypothetical protein
MAVSPSENRADLLVLAQTRKDLRFILHRISVVDVPTCGTPFIQQRNAKSCLFENDYFSLRHFFFFGQSRLAITAKFLSV